MSRTTVTAWSRNDSGKGPARRLRSEGKIPAVLCGGQQETVSLSVDPALLINALDPELKRNTLFDLKIDDNAELNCLAMVKDAQIHPLRDTVMHVDLIRVTEDQMIEVKVPLILSGRSEGVKLGGVLQQIFRMLPVLARADSIPAKIEMDSSTWEIGDIFRVSDLELPPGVVLQLDDKQTLVSIVEGRIEEEEVEEGEEGEEGEGEEGEGEEGDKKSEDSDGDDKKKGK